MKCKECNGRGHYLFMMSTPQCYACGGTGDDDNAARRGEPRSPSYPWGLSGTDYDILLLGTRQQSAYILDSKFGIAIRSMAAYSRYADIMNLPLPVVLRSRAHRTSAFVDAVVREMDAKYGKADQ